MITTRADMQRAELKICPYSCVTTYLSINNKVFSLIDMYYVPVDRIALKYDDDSG